MKGRQAAGIIGDGISGMMRLVLGEGSIQYLHSWASMVAGKDAYAQLWLIMGFFMVMPALISGFENWFVPLMIGALEMAFPLIFFWLKVVVFIMLLGLSFVP
jgi:cytochrome c oxidase subunit I